jgi:hypothetical protein
MWEDHLYEDLEKFYNFASSAKLATVERLRKSGRLSVLLWRADSGSKNTKTN